MNGASYPPLLDAILAADSPSEAWTVILAWYSPNDEAVKYRTRREFEIFAMSDKESPNKCFSRAYLIVIKIRGMRFTRRPLKQTNTSFVAFRLSAS